MAKVFQSFGGDAKITMDLTKLEKLLKNSPEHFDKAIRATGFQVEAKAKTLAPVDTGALRNSIHTVTHDDSTFSQAVGRIQKRKKSRAAAERAVEIPKPDKPMVARVGPGMEYGIYLEFGTSRMAARPYMFPAVQGVEKFLKHYVTKALQDSLS